MSQDDPRENTGNDGPGTRVASAMRRLVPLPKMWSRSRSPDMVFIWVPKTAGTSVFTFLSDHLGMRKLKTAKQAMSFRNRGAVTFGHLHYLSLLEAGIVSRDFHDRAFKFACVRNPYARAASLYNYLRQRNRLDDQCFDRFLDDIRLRAPIGLYNRPTLSMANPITDWVMGQNGDLLVDRLFRVEDMTAFADHFESGYGVRFNPAERRNESERFVSATAVTGHRERVEKINQIYARDFELLGYDMIDPTKVGTAEGPQGAKGQ